MLTTFFLAASLHAAPAPSFPLTPGSQWLYSGNAQWQDENNQFHAAQIRWRMQLLSTRKIKGMQLSIVRGFPTDLAWYTPQSKARYAVLSQLPEGIYLHEDIDTLRQAQQLVNTISKHGKQLDPPIGNLLVESKPDDGECQDEDSSPKPAQAQPYCWHSNKKVSYAGKSGWLLAYRSQPHYSYLGFVPGIGITSFHSGRRSSANTVTVKLIEFTAPGKRPVINKPKGLLSTD